MARQQLRIIAALAALVMLAGCAGGSPGPSDREAACRAKGLTPGTAELAVCLHPNEAAALEQGGEAWDQMRGDVAE